MESNTARKRAQLAAGALLVGVDPHKRMHAVVVMTAKGQIVTRCKIPATRAGFRQLLAVVQTAVIKAGADGAVFGIEAGGHYWRTLSYFLQEAGQPFRLINPLTLKRRREGDDLNRRKTDYQDARVAAELLWQGQFTETRLPVGAYAELRALHQARRRLVRATTRERNLLESLLDGVFPEFGAVFKDSTGRTALAVLRACPVPAVIAGQTAEAFVAQVRGVARGERLAVKKVRALYELAAESVGVPVGTGGVTVELQLLVERLELLLEQTAVVERQLLAAVVQFAEYDYLASVPGLGPLTVAGLIAEIGPIDHYGNGKDLVKLAGVNPICRESAGKGAEHTPMSKQGRAGLRAGLWQAAVGLLRSNPEFQAWAERLRARPAPDRPLHRRAILGAAMHKLLRLYFALVSKRQRYSSQVMAGEVIAA